MKTLYCDNLNCGENEDIEICEPSWEEFRKLILELDGKNKTLITFGDYDMGYYMAIGGGPSQYILYISFDDEERIVELVNQNEKSECLVELLVGGQIGKYPKNTCVNQEMVLTAAKTFFEYQTVDESLFWRE